MAELRQAREVVGVKALILELIAALGNELLEVWLFGSRARGDAHQHSDIDLLIVVDQLRPQLRWRIREVAADCSLEHDVLFNTHILDRAHWAEHVFYKSTLWREVMRDGVVLHDPAVAAPLD